MRRSASTVNTGQMTLPPRDAQLIRQPVVLGRPPHSALAFGHSRGEHNLLNVTGEIMQRSITTYVIPVKDVAAAKTLYSTLLGVEPYADAPYYVGFRVGD